VLEVRARKARGRLPGMSLAPMFKVTYLEGDPSVNTISFAILAFLTAGPRSGYDLKKLFSQSESLHWSGNSNQIYVALVQLHKDGLADREIEQPEEGPAKKVYSLTGAGEAALREWLAGEPELPVYRLPVLARLMAGDLLSGDELDQLLGRYEEQIRLKVAGMEELQRRGRGPSFGSERQRYLWQRINDRAIALSRAEEDWVRETRWMLAKLEKAAK
jgi:PadR family transcriptional regulator AphA